MILTATCRECGQQMQVEADDDCPKDKLDFLASIIVCNPCVDRKRAARRRYAQAKAERVSQPANVVNVHKFIRQYRPPNKINQPF